MPVSCNFMRVRLVDQWVHLVVPCIIPELCVNVLIISEIAKHNIVIKRFRYYNSIIYLRKGMVFLEVFGQQMALGGRGVKMKVVRLFYPFNS